MELPRAAYQEALKKYVRGVADFLNLKDWRVERLIDVGPVDDGLAWAGAN